MLKYNQPMLTGLSIGAISGVAAVALLLRRAPVLRVRRPPGVARVLGVLGFTRGVSTSLVSPAELARWRAGIDSAGWIHMNAAGASPSPSVCHDVVVAHMELERSIGAYAAAAKVQNADSAASALAALPSAWRDDRCSQAGSERHWQGQIDKTGENAGDTHGSGERFLLGRKRWS